MLNKIFKSSQFKIVLLIFFTILTTVFFINYFKVLSLSKELLDLIRSILEVAYFLSGIIIGITAIIALRQLSISKEDIKIRSQREAATEAVEECKKFCNEIIPLNSKILIDLAKLNIPGYSGPPEKDKINDYIKNWLQKLNDTEVLVDFIKLANLLELYSISFTQGIASEKIAFLPTSQSFIEAVELVSPLIFYARIDDEKVYCNTLSLYSNWTNRIKKAKLKIDVDNKVKEINSIKTENIKCIGDIDI